MSEPKFKSGDSVKLNGQDFVITVDKNVPRMYNGEHYYLCKWIDKSQKPQSDFYRESMLTRVS